MSYYVEHNTKEQKQVKTTFVTGVHTRALNTRWLRTLEVEGAKAAAEAKRVVAMASFMVFVMSIYCVMCDGLATSRIYFGLHTQKIHVKVLVEYVYMSCGAVRNDERILPSRISAIFVCHRVMRCVYVIVVGCGWYCMRLRFVQSPTLFLWG